MCNLHTAHSAPRLCGLFATAKPIGHSPECFIILYIFFWGGGPHLGQSPHHIGALFLHSRPCHHQATTLCGMDGALRCHPVIGSGDAPRLRPTCTACLHDYYVYNLASTRTNMIDRAQPIQLSKSPRLHSASVTRYRYL